ncbi:MAG: hypothetical protein NVSMB10_02700 [Steroidobacteraceae bacterium]
MRIARPVYEFLPVMYAAVGAVAMLVAYVDSDEPRSVIALVIGLTAEVAALTVFLRRQDYRALRREYPRESLDKEAK